MTGLEASGLLVATIRDLVASRRRAVALEQERDAYREIAQIALGEVAKLTRSVRRQTETIARLTEDLRRTRRARIV